MAKMNENANQRISPWKAMLISAAGFGIGGAFWGLEAYRGTVGSHEVFTNPFSYVLGAVYLGVFGGLALALIEKLKNLSVPWWVGLFSSENLKRMGRIVGIGTIGWLVAFVVPAVLGEWLLAFGAVLTPLIFVIAKFGSLDVIPLFILKPSLILGQLWVHFLIAGIFIGAVYAILLKTKIVKTALWTGLGFAIASLIGPILGNLVGNVFDSLLISYLVTFLVIGKVFGKVFGFISGRSL